MSDAPESAGVAREKQRLGALICVRSASTRLPEKALVEIANVESIALLIERVKACESFEDIVLCTTMAPEDEKLAAIATRECIDVFRGSAQNVAQRMWGAVQEFGFDNFVRITGDDLLRCIDLIDLAVESHLLHSADYTHVTGVFVGGDSEVISAQALEAVAARAVKSENTEYLSWYLDDPTVFKVNRMVADEKYWRDYRLTLDTPEDLEVIRAVYDALYESGKPIDVVEALEWLDNNEEITRINQGVRLEVDRKDLNLDLYL